MPLVGSYRRAVVVLINPGVIGHALNREVDAARWVHNSDQRGVNPAVSRAEQQVRRLRVPTGVRVEARVVYAYPAVIDLGCRVRPENMPSCLQNAITCSLPADESNGSKLSSVIPPSKASTLSRIEIWRTLAQSQPRPYSSYTRSSARPVQFPSSRCRYGVSGGHSGACRYARRGALGDARHLSTLLPRLPCQKHSTVSHA